ncbi:transcriptional regulator [Paenilisteria newyorkensis]|nr:transcriptional regulator [Listeria newyorkensis]
MGAFFCVFDKYSSGYSNLEKGMVRLTAEKAAVLAEILRCKQEDFFK